MREFGAVSNCQDLAPGELSSRKVMNAGFLTVTVSAGAVGPLRSQEPSARVEGMGNSLLEGLKESTRWLCQGGTCRGGQWPGFELRGAGGSPTP